MTKQIFIHKDENNKTLFDIADQMAIFKRQMEIMFDKASVLKKEFFDELRKFHNEGDLKYINHDEKVMSIEMDDECNCQDCLLKKLIGHDND